MADAHIGRPSARLKADLAAEATTLAQSFFRHLARGAPIVKAGHSQTRGLVAMDDGTAARIVGAAGTDNAERFSLGPTPQSYTHHRHRREHGAKCAPGLTARSKTPIAPKG